jgi:hypothetical protein
MWANCLQGAFSDAHWVWFTLLRDLSRARREAFGCKPFMHFDFYLMIVALVLSEP